MKKLIYLLAVVSLTGCNVFSPFNGTTSTTDLLEMATKCLDEGDFSCAISNYEALPPGATKDENLCTVYLAKAGITVDTLINVVGPGLDPTTFLGVFAQALVPWNSTAQSDVGNAITSCLAFGVDSPGDNLVALLATTAYLGDCALRIAKTDQLLGANATDTGCTTPGPDTGVLTKNHIVTGGGQFMCYTDVIQCQQDGAAMNTTFSAALGEAGLGSLQTAITDLPPGLQSTIGVPVGRTVIQSYLPSP